MRVLSCDARSVRPVKTRCRHLTTRRTRRHPRVGHRIELLKTTRRPDDLSPPDANHGLTWRRDGPWRRVRDVASSRRVRRGKSKSFAWVEREGGDHYQYRHAAASMGQASVPYSHAIQQPACVRREEDWCVSPALCFRHRSECQQRKPAHR